MNKIYQLVPKNLIRPKGTFTFGRNRFSSYDFKRPDFRNDAFFFIVGMYFGYHIGRDTRRRER